MRWIDHIQHPSCLMPEAAVLNFSTIHSRFLERFHASKLLLIILIDSIYTDFSRTFDRDSRDDVVPKAIFESSCKKSETESYERKEIERWEKKWHCICPRRCRHPWTTNFTD